MKGSFGPLTVADPVSEVTRSRAAWITVGAPEEAMGERQLDERQLDERQLDDKLRRCRAQQRLWSPEHNSTCHITCVATE
jgi:hypothetical protein